MKWIPNLDRTLVSVLLGVSLTTLSCVSLAIFFKSLFEKDDEDKDTKNIQKSHQIIKSRYTKVQCKVPKKFVSAIIGRGGSMIKDIEDKTGTQIKISNEDIESTDCICIIRGNEMESIGLAESIIKNIIDSQPIIKSYELLVPYEAWRRYVISHRGSVRDIQSATGTKIIIENGSHKSETGLKRKIILKGTDNQITQAVTYINNVLPYTEENAGLQKNLEKTKDSLFPNNNAVKDTVDNKPIEIIDIQVQSEVYKAILGMNGNIVQQIQRSSGAKIILNDSVDNCLNSSYKEIFIKGTSDQIASAITQINQRSDEILQIRRHLEQDIKTALGTILFYSSNNVENIIIDGKPVSKICKMFISHEICERILERNGETIQELQRLSGAEIIIENEPHKLEDDKRKIMIKGTNNQIITVIRHIADKFPDEVQVPALLSEEVTDDQSINIYEIFVPLVSCKRIESTLQQIQSFSGARIIMENDSESQNCERKITIKGNIDQIAQAVIEIKDQVREEHKHQTELEYKDTESKIKMSDSKGFSSNVGETEFLNISLNDDLIEIRLAAMYDLSKFWIRMAGAADDAYNKLFQEIQQYYNRQENIELHGLKKVELGQMVIVFSTTNQWHRAKVISILNNNEYEVYFVDEGGSWKVHNNSNPEYSTILEIRTDMLSLRAQGMECSLANIKAREKLNGWLQRFFDELDQLYDQFFAKIKGYTKHPDCYGFNHEIVIPCIDLYAKSNSRNEFINVAEYLISVYPSNFQYDETIYSMVNPTSCEEQSLSEDVAKMQLI